MFYRNTKTTRRFLTAVFLLGISAIMLSGCGSTKTDRALSGGAIGAGAGAGAGVLTGGGIGRGALIGGAAGAATGALTDEDQLDLGEPIWNR